jgi:hypothetical protein
MAKTTHFTIHPMPQCVTKKGGPCHDPSAPWSYLPAGTGEHPRNRESQGGQMRSHTRNPTPKKTTMDGDD